MPLKYKKEPSDAKEAVEKQLEKMASNKAFRTAGLMKIQKAEKTSELTTDLVIPVYHMSLDDIKQGKDLSSAQQMSWRYLLKHEDQVVATADALIKQDGETVFSHVNEGPLVSGVIKALNKAEDIDELQDGDFEVRLLMVPALYVAALWFVDTSGGQELVIPVEPSSEPLRANEIISVNKLLEDLRELSKAHTDIES